MLRKHSLFLVFTNAGDELTPLQMCEAFSQAQGGQPVTLKRPPALARWAVQFISRDLFNIMQFLSTKGYRANVEECRKVGVCLFFVWQTDDTADWFLLLS